MQSIRRITKSGPRFDAGAAQPSAVVRPDPAPSRLTYRMERLMLTPLFRFALRVGLPCLLVFGGGGLWFSAQSNRDAFELMLSDIRAQIESRPEFQVRLLAIDGASEGVSEDVRSLLGLKFPVSSFDLELEELQDKVMTLDAVQDAHLRIRQGGVLQIDVTERKPAVLWRHAEGLDLLDERGIRVGPATSRAAHPGMPVIAGEAAEEDVAEALTLFQAIGPLSSRLRGFERIGARRWDVVLDRGQRLMLPERNALAALERMIAMDQAVDMLARDLVTVDLRLPRRPTVRMTDDAVQELWRIMAIEVEQ